jgi:hypothetical protein
MYMIKDKAPDAIRPQRISNKNIEVVITLGKMDVGESFDEVLTRVLKQCKVNHDEINRLKDEIKALKEEYKHG